MTKTYHRFCNHCGQEFASSERYLSHCRDQARGTGHGVPGTVCDDIKTCSWVNLNVAPQEYLDELSELCPPGMAYIVDTRYFGKVVLDPIFPLLRDVC